MTEEEFEAFKATLKTRAMNYIGPGFTWAAAMSFATKEELEERLPITENVDEIWAECERRRAAAR